MKRIIGTQRLCVWDLNGTHRVDWYFPKYKHRCWIGIGRYDYFMGLRDWLQSSNVSLLSHGCSHRLRSQGIRFRSISTRACPSLTQIQQNAAERAEAFSTQMVHRTVDIGRLQKVLAFLRDEVHIPSINIDYICSHKWNAIVKLSQLPNFDGCRQILARLKTAGTYMNRIDIDDVLLHHIDLLTYTIHDLENRLKDAKDLNVPYGEFSSIIEAKWKEKNQQSQNQGFIESYRLTKLLRDASICTSTTVSHVSLSKCLECDPRLQMLNVAPRISKERMLEMSQINQIAYLTQEFMKCGIQTENILEEVLEVLEKGDFINEIFNRIEFMKSRNLLTSELKHIKHLLLLNKTQFLKCQEFKNLGLFQFELFKRRQGHEPITKLLTDVTYTSQYINQPSVSSLNNSFSVKIDLNNLFFLD